MTSLRPRSVVHRGVVDAAGVMLDPQLIGEAVCRRRVLSLWQPNSRLYDFGERYVLIFETQR